MQIARLWRWHRLVCRRLSDSVTSESLTRSLFHLKLLLILWPQPIIGLKQFLHISAIFKDFKDICVIMPPSPDHQPEWQYWRIFGTMHCSKGRAASIEQQIFSNIFCLRTHDANIYDFPIYLHFLYICSENSLPYYRIYIIVSGGNILQPLGTNEKYFNIAFSIYFYDTNVAMPRPSKLYIYCKF